MLILSDLLFYYRSFTNILSCILVEGGYSRTKVTQKYNYDERNQSYFESCCSFNIYWKGQLSQKDVMKETSYLNYFF